MGQLLPQAFYDRDALDVARDLLGAFLCRECVVLRITEVEAYRWPNDTANHCRFGKTARNAPMWGPAGHAYVYLCYGLHNMLNIVTGPEGEGAAVLVRSCEPVDGLEVIAARRGGRRDPVALTGPGKVGAALALDTTWSHHPLFLAGGLEVREGGCPTQIAVGPRVGIDFAETSDRQASWRLADADSKWVSLRKGLAVTEQTR